MKANRPVQTQKKIDYAIAASYNCFISKQELKAYQQGYQPELHANATGASVKGLLPVINI